MDNQKYNEYQRNMYNKLRQDEVWREQFNARCKRNNKVYREKKEKVNEALGIIKKPRGRPKKPITYVNTHNIPLLNEIEK